ncbi:MAG: dienelactone hydrolase family protein [Chloroflexi bacterium]|nr:dienelactone hydrolase family protein [Chloroflexota bacterium]
MPILNGPSRAPHAGGAPDSLAILLHGLGADGNDLIGLTIALGPRFPHMAFHSPDAPNPYVEAGFGLRWFPLEPPDERAAGLRKAGEVVETYVGELLEEYGLTPDRCVLIGFSQGCMTSLYAAPRMERQVAGVVGLSGALLFPEWLANEVRQKPPIVLVHGDQDMVLPPESTAHAGQTLAEVGLPVEAYVLPGLGHSIDPRGLEIASRFIENVLGLPDGAE